MEESGYVEHEYVASGTASSYSATGPLSGDGRWTFEPDGTAPYRTRILVRRPANAADFSGTVVVEWLNVSGGVDANPDYASLEEELTRQGHAWVGVSAQLIGVEGGPVLVAAPGAEDLAGKGLKSDRPGALRIARAPRRRLLVRHLHAGGASAARGRTGAGRLEAAAGARGR